MIVAGVAISLTSSARAEAVVRYPERENEKPDTAWYGWQIAIADAAAAPLIYWGIESDERAPLYAGGIVYLLVPPTIHALHDRDGAMLGSFGLRLVLPLLVGFSTIPRGGDDDGDSDYWPEIVLLSMVTASAIDIAFISIPLERQKPSQAATLHPLLTVSGARAVLGAGGTF